LKKEGMEALGEDGFDGTPSELFGHAVQAHHCISCSVIQRHKDKATSILAIKSGYDINNGNNNIFLPSKFGFMRINNDQRHRGGHWDKYYKYVEKKLDAFYKEHKDDDPCNNDEDKKNILSDLKDIEKKIYSDLDNRRQWLYDWSEKLYNEDYKEEGPGALTSDNQQPSSSAGLAWVENYPKGKRRRKHYNNNLKITWYSSKGFPPPGSATA